MKKKNNDLIIVPKKEYSIKYHVNPAPNIKHLKNDYETIRNKVLNDDENSTNKIDIENKNKNVIHKRIINFKII